MLHALQEEQKRIQKLQAKGFRGVDLWQMSDECAL